MLRIGLLGYGHLGKIHFKCLQQTPFTLKAVYDPKYAPGDVDDVPFVDDISVLLQNVDACIIASDTKHHFDLAMRAIDKDKHIFIEKPMTQTLDQAHALVDALRAKPQLISTVGFVERYNPAYKAVQSQINNPRFIEVHRLAMFNPRGSDVSVVSDLMIHDIDLLLSMKDAPIKELRASGVKLITDTLDICNARIEFEDNTVANITASRISMKNMRKFRIFQEDAYISLDLQNKKSEMVYLSDLPKEGYMEIPEIPKPKYMSVKTTGPVEGNAILDEQNVFYNAIKTQTQTATNLARALKTSTLADQIENLALKSAGNI